MNKNISVDTFYQEFYNINSKVENWKNGSKVLPADSVNHVCQAIALELKEKISVFTSHLDLLKIFSKDIELYSVRSLKHIKIIESLDKFKDSFPSNYIISKDEAFLSLQRSITQVMTRLLQNHLKIQECMNDFTQISHDQNRFHSDLESLCFSERSDCKFEEQVLIHSCKHFTERLKEIKTLVQGFNNKYFPTLADSSLIDLHLKGLTNCSMQYQKQLTAEIDKWSFAIKKGTVFTWERHTQSYYSLLKLVSEGGSKIDNEVFEIYKPLKSHSVHIFRALEKKMVDLMQESHQNHLKNCELYNHAYLQFKVKLSSLIEKGTIYGAYNRINLSLETVQIKKLDLLGENSDLYNPLGSRFLAEIGSIEGLKMDKEFIQIYESRDIASRYLIKRLRKVKNEMVDESKENYLESCKLYNHFYRQFLADLTSQLIQEVGKEFNGSFKPFNKSDEEKQEFDGDLFRFLMKWSDRFK